MNKLQKVLLDKTGSIDKITGRRLTFTIPKAEDGDIERKINFRADDGLLLHLIKRIEELEKKKK